MMHTKKLSEMKSTEERRRFLESVKRISLSGISVYPEGLEEQASRKNCENMIGVVHIPVGVAGPLPIEGTRASGEYFIPLATTEGALIASVNRGCKAIKASGSAVSAVTENAGITRSTVFEASNLKAAFVFVSWLKQQSDMFQSVAAQVSGHLSFIGNREKVIGNRIFVRFAFDSQEAMGMNMATIAVHKIAAEIIRLYKEITCISIAANFDIDKKPAWLNSILGRGRTAWAEAYINRDTVASVLKTTPEKIYEVWLSKCMIGSAVSGSLGFNSHFANIVAAVFLACGQDAAHIAEGSLGMTTTEVKNGNLWITCHLPDLPLGTTGGGTTLPAQESMLSLLGLAGGITGEKSAEFAEIVSAAVLAGELSLLASLAQGSLAPAHSRLGRNGKDNL